MILLAIGLAVYAFLLRAAAGGLTAVDPSRLAPMKGATGFTSPVSLERAVAVANFGSFMAATTAFCFFGRVALDAWGWPGFAGVVLLSMIVAYPLIEILPLLYTTPRGGLRLILGIVAFAPVSIPLGIVRTIVRWLIEGVVAGDGPDAPRVMSVRREALASLSGETPDVRTLREAQKQLVTQVYEFGESTVEEVMVPRSQVVGIVSSATVEDVVRLTEEHQFSRYPVYSENLDHVDGVVHIFDLLSAPDPAAPISPYMRPITFAPAAKKCDELLSELQKKYQHAAVVVDEFGGMAGWVTVEDLLEELVGEIRDEHDDEEEMVRSLGPRSYMLDAQMRIDDLNRMFHLGVPEGDYETVAGFLIEEMERIPVPGDKMDYDWARFVVVSAEPRRIVRVRLEIPDRNGN